MRIAVGSDHAGYALKSLLSVHLAAAGHDVLDLGTDSGEISVDYPLFGSAVGRAVADGRAERGLCVCGSGIGISMAANKVPGVRAAVVHDSTTASLARRHNDANVVALAGRFTDPATADEIVDVFMNTPFEGGRHAARVGMLDRIDAENTETC